MWTSMQEFSQAFVSSIGDWSPSETLRVGQDPGGSRVLEALVNAAAASKAKKKLLRKLKGMWAILAVEPGGNHVVESCFVWGVRLFFSQHVDHMLFPPAVLFPIPIPFLPPHPPLATLPCLTFCIPSPLPFCHLFPLSPPFLSPTNLSRGRGWARSAFGDVWNMHVVSPGHTHWWPIPIMLTYQQC